jgi:hypothetical protein
MAERPTLPVVIELDDPVEVGSKRIDSLTLTRKPKVKDIRGLALISLDDMETVLTRVFGLTKVETGELTTSDFEKIIEILTPFLRNSPETETES